MSFQELAKKRYSVRAYKKDPVEDKKLEKILEAARLAPTAANRQPIRLIVIHTAGKEEQLSKIYKADWFVNAPVIICVCAVPSEAWTRMDGKNYSLVDASIVMDHIILVATDLGLGTCWIANFDPSAARHVLNLPDDVEPVVFTPIGYADDLPSGKKRKTLDQLVKYESL